MTVPFFYLGDLRASRNGTVVRRPLRRMQFDTVDDLYPFRVRLTPEWVHPAFYPALYSDGLEGLCSPSYTVTLEKHSICAN